MNLDGFQLLYFFVTVHQYRLSLENSLTQMTTVDFVASACLNQEILFNFLSTHTHTQSENSEVKEESPRLREQMAAKRSFAKQM